jgi:phosphinothricin acetyltransferase
MAIRVLEPADWEAVARIYAEGIATGNATFETQVPSWEIWDADHMPELRLVAVNGDNVIGWAALSGTSRRDCYCGVAESSIYVGAEARAAASGGRSWRS